MNNRTYGETINCKGCRFWSEMIAEVKCGQVVAMCLSINGPLHSKYTAGFDSCPAWKSGHYGAIDSPGESEEIMALYEVDEE